MLHPSRIRSLKERTSQKPIAKAVRTAVYISVYSNTNGKRFKVSYVVTQCLNTIEVKLEIRDVVRRVRVVISSNWTLPTSRSFRIGT